MQICLIPLMGALHLRYPSYNAVAVRDVMIAFNPDAVAISALEPDALSNKHWQDTAEIALPLTVMPWLKKQSLELHLIHEPSPDETAQADFYRFANEYPQLGQKLSQTEAFLRPLNSLLAETLSLTRILKEVVPLLKDYQENKEQLLEDGPATDWLHERVNRMAKHILKLKENKIAVLASIDHIPFLTAALAEHTEILEPPEIDISEESRERSLLDFAFRLDVPEPGNLIAKLRELESPEARYHEANLLLNNAHVPEALKVLEKASQTDFAEPYYLPGFLLSRLGQLYDLMGNRKAAIRSYNGVRALSYAPIEALEAAKKGIEKAFGEEDATS